MAKVSHQSLKGRKATKNRLGTLHCYIDNKRLWQAKHLFRFTRRMSNATPHLFCYLNSLYYFKFLTIHQLESHFLPVVIKMYHQKVLKQKQINDLKQRDTFKQLKVD